MLPDLIALDLDGTLLPRDKVLPPRVIAAVAAARAAGARIVVASGKSFHLSARYAGELGLEGPVIALDGSLVRTCPGDEVWSETGIDPARTEALVDLLRPAGLLPFLVDSEDRLLLHEDLAEASRFLVVYSDRIDLSPRPTREARGVRYFLGMLGGPGAAIRGEILLRENGIDGLYRYRAEFRDRDLSMLVLRPPTDKGSALAVVASRLGIPRERVAAVGDWKNDRKMIEWAGIGVAMANAHPDVIAVADVVLPFNSEDAGIAAWLEEML